MEENNLNFPASKPNLEIDWSERNRNIRYLCTVPVYAYTHVSSTNMGGAFSKSASPLKRPELDCITYTVRPAAREDIPAILWMIQVELYNFV